MFDFGKANDAQKLAIQTTDGPVLITAGPGTGKTFTLVKRVLFLIQERNVKPEQIFIATFTEKAAKELITRITNELSERSIAVNINDMYVGTFHSLCLRIIKEHLEFTKFKKNYRLLDAFAQQYMVFQKFGQFKNLPNVEDLFSNKSSKWWKAGTICSLVNNLSEELVEASKLIGDDDPQIQAIGHLLAKYQKLMYAENCIDFSTIQTECYKLLKDNQAILAEIQGKIEYFMIDEYQDTNYIQEQLVFLMAGAKKNICVVGDDDQGLYRFRGATIRNILEFPNKFPKGECKIVSLVENYRSDSDIIDFYNKWMQSTTWQGGGFEWDKYRYPKKIVSYQDSQIASSTAVSLTGDTEEDWQRKILDFILELKLKQKITDYNQVAFLCNSVKNHRVVALAKYLENHGVNVYSPRSNMFFERREVRLAIGAIIFLFPDYAGKLEIDNYKYLAKFNDRGEENRDYKYFMDCYTDMSLLLKLPEYQDLRSFIAQTGKGHSSLTRNLDYGYTGLLYRLFRFEPFLSILDVDMKAGVFDLRATRNLAKLTNIIASYEQLHGITVLTAKNIVGATENLFNIYMKLLFNGGIGEYEDDSEYAPSGCVSFLTIHQSKGMEFPVVLVDSLDSVPKDKNKNIMLKIETKYFHRSAFEPYDRMKYFDFWRLYYTAFSRAQDLLILTCPKSFATEKKEKSGLSKYFKEPYKSLPKLYGLQFDLEAFTFKPIKDVNIKDKFSFTSHISVYENCPMQYKFYRELGFTPVKVGAMVFGTLVHETIEDIHRAAIRHEEQIITDENIEKWLYSNYASISKKEHSYLGKSQLEVALEQVLAYKKRQENNWKNIQEAEVDVSLVKPDYIIEGKIDLVEGNDNTVKLIDFKSEKKPDLFDAKDKDRIEHYRRQLNVYAHLLEERRGQKVSEMCLYYTGEKDGSPWVRFPYTKTAIEGTMAAFDDTVHKILQKDYNHRCENKRICKECDFGFYCGRK